MKLGKVLKENLEKKINKDNFKYGALKKMIEKLSV